MTAAKIVVTLLGIGAIAWVNYYFFFVGRPATRVGVDPRLSP